MRRKKHAFLLIELLIALSLFILCIVPLIEMPFSAINSEIKNYQRLQLHRIADLTFVDIESQLFQNIPSWDEIKVKKNRKTQLSKNIVTIDLQGFGQKKIQQTCSIWTSRCKQGKQAEQYRLLTVEIQFKALNDSHFFLKKKLSSDTMTLRRQIFVIQKTNAVLTPSEIQS